MNQSTKEQWFWEQCGFTFIKEYGCFTMKEGDEKSLLFSGAIDLNNLKLYAFPLMDKVSIYIDNEYLGKKRNKVRVMYKNSFYDGENECLETAVFEAIYKSLGGKE